MNAFLGKERFTSGKTWDGLSFSELFQVVWSWKATASKSNWDRVGFVLSQERFPGSPCAVKLRFNFYGRSQTEATKSTKARSFLQRWIVTTLAVAVAANVVPGITYSDPIGLLLGSLLLGILNAFLRPFLLFLSLPLLLVTLGLFTLVINAALLWLVGTVLNSFHVRDFSAAFWGGLVISLVSVAINVLLGRPAKREEKSGDHPTRKPPSDGGGPIIDV